MDQHTGPTPAGAPEDPERGIEMFERDGSGALRPVVSGGSAAGRGRAFGVSVPGAIAAALLVGALAFGAGGFSPVRDEAPDATPGTETARDEDATGSPTHEASEAPRPDEKASPEVAETDEPAVEPRETDEPTKEPDPTEVPPTKAPYERLELAVKAGADGVVLDWTACDAAGFAYYKVVRSPDGKVSWPMGDNDTLVAAIDARKTTAFRDAKAPTGKQLYYRVFGIVEQDGKLVVACLSSVEDAFVPRPDGTKPPTETGTMSLALGIKDGHPFLDWSECTNDAFDYYKVVWSKDATVTWPAGDNDHFAAAIGNRDETALWDTEAPGGKTLYYRVFCVKATDGGYQVLAATPVKSVTTPAPEPPPAPVGLGFSVDVTGEGVVVLDWEASTSDAFVYYKVVRSQAGDPSYLPWTDGTELIGVIEDPGNSAFEDADVASGETWYYRVQAIGRWEGQKVVLGETAVLEVAVP